MTTLRGDAKLLRANLFVLGGLRPGGEENLNLVRNARSEAEMRRSGLEQVKKLTRPG